MVTFLCDKTLRSDVDFLPDKRAETVTNSCRRFANRVEHGECIITRFRSDGGGEFDNNIGGEYRFSKGITWEATIPSTPQQNGKSERLGQTLHKIASANLKASKLPDRFWAEFMRTANYLRNRQPVPGRDVTPFQACTTHVPRADHLRIIGQTGLCQDRKYPGERFSHFQTRTRRGKLIGYEPHGYRMLMEDTGKVLVFDNVKWINNVPATKLALEHTPDTEIPKRRKIFLYSISARGEVSTRS